MEFLITEEQLRIILEGKDKSKMFEYMKILYSFISEVSNRVTKKYKINVKMLVSWGAAIAGLVMPLDNFLKTGQFNLTEDERYLISTGVAFLVFFETKRVTTQLLNKIEENGLEEPFEAALDKGLKLKNSFFGFLESLNIVTNNLMEVVSYAFLIPIVSDIQKIVEKSSDADGASSLIAERLLASGVVLISSELVFNIVKKITSKFR
jgi:hypothetical protein